MHLRGDLAGLSMYDFCRGKKKRKENMREIEIKHVMRDNKTEAQHH